MVNHNQLHQHGGTPLVVESRSGESESKSESPTGESESESESPKNGTRVGLESEYYNSEIKTLNNKMPLGTLNTK